MLIVDLTGAAAQQTGSALYFAYDEVRSAKLLERKEILEYKVILAGERRYRETFFDTADLDLYHQRMFYRVKENFDGQGQMEFYSGGAAREGASIGMIYSVVLPPSKVSFAREGRLTDPAVKKRLPLPTGRNPNTLQLAVEYARHSVLLEHPGKQEFLVSLLVGTFEGYSGRKLRKQFWALEVEATAKRLTPAHVREIQRIADSLIPDFRLNANPRSLYAQGIEKAVLVRSDERVIQPVGIIGGSRGNSFDQFDMPDAVAFTLDGKLVTGDTDNARFKVYRFDENSQTVKIIGREGSAAGEFSHSVAATIGTRKIYNQVQGITVDKHGLIYVIDQGNRRIQAFDSEGRVLEEKTIHLSYCGNESPRCPEGLWRPTQKNEYTSLQGIASDHEGAIFISDKGMSRIYRFLPGGKQDPGFHLQEVDPATDQPILQEPESLAVYQDKLFVANEGTGEIKIFDRRTGKLMGSTARFGRGVFAGDVEGLAVVQDYLFAVDVQNTRIAVFDLKDELPTFQLGFVGDYESADGIAIDPTGKYVAVADQGNLRVVLYSLSEILRHLRGAKR
jgi:sugar lactone lactonase YvrE